MKSEEGTKIVDIINDIAADTTLTAEQKYEKISTDPNLKDAANEILTKMINGDETPTAPIEEVKKEEDTRTTDTTQKVEEPVKEEPKEPVVKIVV